MTPAIRPPRHSGLLLVALYEFTKGLVLVLVAIGLLRLLGRDLQAVVTGWAHALRLNLQNHFVDHLLARAGLINPWELKQLSALSFFLGALHLTQGVGLFLEKRWAEYLTIVATATFIPLEIYELTRHLTPTRAAVLIANVALVAYLASLLRRGRSKAPPHLTPPPA